MFIRTKTKPNGKTAVQIVESYRRANKITQKITRHIGQAFNEKELIELKKLAATIIRELEEERQPSLPIFNPEKISQLEMKNVTPQEPEKVELKNLREEQRVIDGIGDVFGTLYDDLGFNHLITGTKLNDNWNDVLKTCVLARLANPSSKRRTASNLERDFGIRLSLSRIYRMMEHVSRREEAIREHVGQATRKLFTDEINILFFDVTTLYFESFEEDALRRFGFSKDCKFKETQVVLALVTTEEGLPIDYMLFPGDMYEGHTLVEMVKELKSKYSVAKVRLVADRAMFNEKNLEMMESEGIQYVVAAKLKAMSKEMKDRIQEESGYHAGVVMDELHWIQEIPYEKRRLIVSYSSARARKDSADRQRLIERLLKKQKNGKIPVKKLIGNRGTSKYIQVNESDITVNEKKIEEDAVWDGLHGVVTNAPLDQKAEELLTLYRGLWQIEDAFRLQKHDLKLRPIYHWTPNRIRAHIAICFIAYSLAKQAMYRLKLRQYPMSFNQLLDELLHAQSSILVDQSTKKQYIIPSHANETLKRIYQTFGLKRNVVPRKIGD